MTRANEAQPSRAMDAAVARAMGANLGRSDSAEWTRERDYTEPGDHYIIHESGSIGLLPGYSTLGWYEDRAALLDAVLWLAGKGAGVFNQDDTFWAEYQPGGHPICFVPGVNLATFALCACRAVLIVAGVEEVEDA